MKLLQAEAPLQYNKKECPSFNEGHSFFVLSFIFISYVSI